MSRKRITVSAWRKIIRLGEEMLLLDSISAQRDLIDKTARELFEAESQLWLDNALFSLPGRDGKLLFDPIPASGAMSRAYSGESLCVIEERILAAPLHGQQITMGVLQIERPESRPFTASERNIFEGFAGHVAMALALSRRVVIEQWRIEQLNLVKDVSAQIAHVLDLEELTRQLTDLILHTFQYYYVAIFTLDPGQLELHFRSSSGPAKRRGRRKKSPVLKVELGEGMIGVVAQDGREILANDVKSEPRFRFIGSLPETCSEVVLPLKIGDRVLGVLDVQSDQVDAFHPNDLLVLRALADTIAMAVSNAQLYGDLQRRIDQLALVAEVSDDINSRLDLDELFTEVAGLIHDQFGFPHVQLFTVHPNRRQIIYEGGIGARSEALDGYSLSLDAAEGIIPWVARNSETVLANDVTQDSRYKPSPFPPTDTLSELTVPLIFDKQVVGILDLQSDRRDAFSEDDRFLCDALADNVAVAIHNADLYRSETWRRQVADSLREVAGLLSADVSLDDVLDSILRELERNLPCDVSAIWLLEEDHLYLAHIHGADPLEVEAALQRWPESAEYMTDALDEDEPVIRKPTDPLGPTGASCGFAADYSSIAATLRIADQPVGILTLSHRSPGRYGHEAQAMTATFASYAAVAIENTRLYDAAQEQAYASAALLQVAQTVANSNNLDEILGSIVRITPILVGVQACGIYLLEGDILRPAQFYNFPNEIETALFGEAFDPASSAFLRTIQDLNQMVVGVLPTGALEEWLNPEMALSDEKLLDVLETGENLLIGIPLLIKNVLYGVIVVRETSKLRRFRMKRVEIITSIAQQVALAIQNEQLQADMVVRERLEHEVELARQIQMTFLPEVLPSYPDWEVAATWRTARQVGGDFYDVIELPGERLGLFIADVSDKGIPAALFMALTRTLFRAVVYDAASPAEALSRLNELIIPDNHQAMFVTAVYGVLDMKDGRFTYANAGHNPPLFYTPGKGYERMTRTCAALGIFESMEIQNRTIELGVDDYILFYTDGLTEAFAVDDSIYGEERLCSFLQANQFLHATDILAAVEASVDEFMGGLPATDDLTMLALMRKQVR
ncbi:MAG: GAF domain-containing protein [Chloroflexota bacterium]